RERGVERGTVRRLEEEDAAVIPAGEHHDRGPAGGDPRKGHREEVRLGAGVAEPDELDRGEALAERAGELDLVAVRRAEGKAVGERVANRLQHCGMRVAVEARG